MAVVMQQHAGYLPPLLHEKSCQQLTLHEALLLVYVHKRCLVGIKLPLQPLEVVVANALLCCLSRKGHDLRLLLLCCCGQVLHSPAGRRAVGARA